MGNVLKIARKEFIDLYSSWFVLFILIVYALSIGKTVFDFYNVVLVQHGETGPRLLNVILDGVWHILAYYGVFVGIVIGFSSVASEKHKSALSTLLVKPLYRDSIINGKLLGVTGFLCCTFALAIALFTAAMFIVCGGTFASFFIQYLEAVPLLFALSVVFVLIFVLVSMLISILVRDQAFALVATVLALFIMDIGRSNTIAGFLSHIIAGGPDAGLCQAIARLSPYGLIEKVSLCLYPPTLPGGVIVVPGFSLESIVADMVIFLLIALVSCYIAFIRRDIP